MAEDRFAAFTPEELLELWEGLVYDDGLRYYPEAGTVERRLAEEIEDWWTRSVPPTIGRNYSLEEARHERDVRGQFPFTTFRRVDAGG